MMIVLKQVIFKMIESRTIRLQELRILQVVEEFFSMLDPLDDEWNPSGRFQLRLCSSVNSDSSLQANFLDLPVVKFSIVYYIL